MEWLPGGSLRLVEKLAEISAKIANVLPTGYSITNIWSEQKKLKFIIAEETSLRALPLPAVIIGIIAAVIDIIWPVLILIGVVIITWKIIDLFIEKEITRQIIEKSELIEKAKEAGLNPDQIGDVLSSVDRERISDVLKWISIIAGITIVGVGGIIAFKELRKVKA